MSVSLITSLAQPLKSAAQFVAYQEKTSNLAPVRFVQDTSVCFFPKAVFARSKEDFAENAGLEMAENGLVYFAPALLGEKAARKIFSKGLSTEAKELIATPAAELLSKNNALNNKVIPIKAAIALTALLIPLTEFTLNYIKNLFTLKVFKKGNFNNIANLEATKEDKEFQNKVEKSAYRNIKKAAAIFAGCLGLGILAAKKGADSKIMQNISEFILAPGTKLFKNNPKKRDFLNKYFSQDFGGEKGKLVLSKGQLTSCVLVGGAGYFGAAKDRGKQNFLETLFRFPLVGFYIITGSDLFEKGFKKLLQKAGKCKELINLEVPAFEKLEEIAKDLAAKNNSSLNTEYKKLAKQKVLISGAPFLFGIAVMGLFVTGVSNAFTRYRYKTEQKQKALKAQFMDNTRPVHTTETFKAFFQ